MTYGPRENCKKTSKACQWRKSTVLFMSIPRKKLPVGLNFYPINHCCQFVKSMKSTSIVPMSLLFLMCFFQSISGIA